MELLRPTHRAVIAGLVVGLAILTLAGRLEQRALPTSVPALARERPAPAQRGAPRASPVVARIPLGSPAASLVVGAGGVWTLHEGGTVLRVDPAADRVAARIGVHPWAQPLWVQDGAAWVSSRDGAETTRIDPATGRARPAAKPPRELRGGGVAWRLCCQQHGGATLVAVGARDSRPLARFRFPAGVDDVAAAGGEVAWVLSAGRLLRANARGGALGPVRLPGSARLLTAGEGAVWVACDQVELPASRGAHLGKALLRVDPASGEADAITDLSWLVVLDGLAAGEGGVWLTGEDASPQTAWLIARVDPVTTRVTASYDTGSHQSGHLALGYGSVWYAVGDSGELLRVDPARMAS